MRTPLGGGPEQKDLYTGDFVSVDVLDDLYYNTNLVSVQVGTAKAVAISPLTGKYAQTMISNSIIDSGTNSLCLTPQVYQAVVNGLESVDSGFAKIIQAASNMQPVDAAELDLADLPDIIFTLTGEAGDEVSLTVRPSTYWQLNAGQAGDACS